MPKSFISWHQIGFPDPNNITIGAIEFQHVTLVNIYHGLSHRNRFTTSSAYKLGLKSPILAEKAQIIVIFYSKLDFQIKIKKILYT